MSDERNLISKILHQQDMADVVDAGIKPHFFLDPNHRAAFKAIVDHHTKYSTVPTIETFKKDYPTYKIAEAKDAVGYYIDAVIEAYSLSLLEDGLFEAIETFENDEPVKSRNAIAKTLANLDRDVSGSRVTDLTETSDKRLERYRAYRKNSGSLKGISSGFHSIDMATGGFQRKQLITFVGPPKAGKSTIMLLSMIAAHQSYYRPLFIGFEMSNEEQEERHDAIRAAISHKKLREGRLSAQEFKRLASMTKRLENAPPLIFSEDANSSLTLSGVASQIERYDPDAVFIDGVYMMDDENGERKGSPQALTNITRGFKQMAKNRDLPVIISTQVLEWKMDRKRGITSSSIGYSSSFIQDSDQVIGVEKTDDPTVNKLKVVLGRNNPGMETFVRWDWETGEFEELEDYEQEGDTDDEASKKF